MATKRTYMDPITGTVITFNENRTYMSPFGAVVTESKLAVITPVIIPVIMHSYKQRRV